MSSTSPEFQVPQVGFLTSKEIVSFLQKLSQVEKQNFSPSALEEDVASSVALLRYHESDHSVRIHSGCDSLETRCRQLSPKIL